MSVWDRLADLIAGRKRNTSDVTDAKGNAALATYPFPSDGTTMPAYPAQMQFQPFALAPDVLTAPAMMTKLAVFRRAVLMRAGDVARTPIIWEREKRGGTWEPVERKPGNVVDVFARANPVETGYQLVRGWLAFYVATGSAYLVARRHLGSMAPPTEFWVAKTHLVEIVPGRHRSPAAYLYSRGGKKERIEPEDCIPLLDFNAEESPYGSGAVQSIVHQAQARYDIPRLISKLIANGGQTGGYFKLNVPNGVQVAQPAEGVIDEWEKKLNRKLTFEQAFRHHVLPLLEYVRTNLTPDELGIDVMLRELDGDIINATGVYPWMMGIKSGSGGNMGADKSGSEQDLLCYVDETLEGDFVTVEGVLTERVGPMFEPGIRARFDRAAVPAIMERRLRVAKMYADLTGGAVASPNEARKGSGLDLPKDPDPESDKIRQSGFGGAFGADPGASPNEPAAGKQAPEDKPAAKSATREKRWVESSGQRRRRVARQLGAAEKKVQRRFRAIFDSQEETVHAWADKRFGTRARDQRLDVADLLDVDFEDEAAINAIFTDLVAERGEAALAQVASELDAALLAANASRYVDVQVARVIRDTTKTTAAQLRDALAAISDSIVEGETYAQTVHRLITQVFDGRRANAATIARTETVRAYSWAALDAWRQAPEVDYVRWVTAQDDGDRHPSYADLEGQVRRIGDRFQVGDALLEYPGDPSGPPGETCNCRCALEPELDPDAEEKAAEKARAMAITRFLFPKNGNGHRPTNRIAKELEALS